jgi:hypothetical protein
MATATHTAAEILWSLSPAQRHKQERLYSGVREKVVLTVTVFNPIPPAGAVKIVLMKNGAAVPDGVITKLNAVTSRTWFLKGVKRLDLVSLDGKHCSGSHAITVVF